ncbi:MAG: hypothetical protein ACXVJ7_15180 [Acidimicrobiia bacterium]
MDATSVYRGLVRLYPRSFREEYGEDLVALFAEQCRDEPPVRVYARAAVDLILTIPVRHLEVPMPRRAPTAMIVSCAALAVGGFIAAGSSGTNYVGGTIGLLVTVLATALGITTWRRNLFTAPVEGSGAWWKLLAAGATLIGGVIIGAQAEVEAWYVGLTMVLGGMALILAGLMLGGYRLLQRRSSLAG